MSALPRTRRLASLLALTATLAGACALASAQTPPSPGGTVPSVLALSVREPSALRSVGDGVFVSTIRVEVTATETPTRLSLADGEVTAGARLGHLVRGSSILSPALRAAADGGSYRSLDASVPPPLRTWGQPLSRAVSRIRVRQSAPHAGTLRGYEKLLLVTLTAAGP